MSKFKTDVDFLILSEKSYFYWIKILLAEYSIFVIKPQIYVKLCLKTKIALFLGKMWKNDSNALKTWPLGTDTAYNC